MDWEARALTLSRRFAYDGIRDEKVPIQRMILQLCIHQPNGDGTVHVEL